MTDTALMDPVSPSESEAFEALKQLAGRRTLPIPAELLVRHVLALPEAPADAASALMSLFDGMARLLSAAAAGPAEGADAPRGSLPS